MKYILNETPLRTTNGFRINDISLELDLNKEIDLENLQSDISDDISVDSKLSDKYSTNIGLEFDKKLLTNINVLRTTDKVQKFKHNLKDSIRVHDINVNVDNGLSSYLYFAFESGDDTSSINNTNLNINADNNSKLNITLLNKTGKDTKSFISINSNVYNSSELTINIIDLSGSIRLYNVKSNTNENSTSILNNIYIGKKDELIDLNYHYANKGKLSNNIIEVQGILDDNSKKHFKGTIDFIEGAKSSIGHENENCLILSNEAISRSLPMMLCGEEDVDGSHSVSSGKLDNNKLFYLMSRGLSKNEATKMLISSNLYKVINNIPLEIKNEIEDLLDLYI